MTALRNPTGVEFHNDAPAQALLEEIRRPDGSLPKAVLGWRVLGRSKREILYAQGKAPGLSTYLIAQAANWMPNPPSG